MMKHLSFNTLVKKFILSATVHLSRAIFFSPFSSLFFVRINIKAKASSNLSKLNWLKTILVSPTGLDILNKKYNENSGINIIKNKSKIQFSSNPNIADSIADII